MLRNLFSPAPFRPGMEPDLAAEITKAASTQTYFTIRLLVDRERVQDAYRAYAYFRWVDDRLDTAGEAQRDRTTFVDRQQALLEACYRGEGLPELCAEERMLVELVGNDREEDSGLQTYLRNMMAVMVFDVRRRGRLITEAELDEYTRLLATAVMEALHHFIGHCCPKPCIEMRYLAVRGAHVVHMLRDALEDTAAGYYNIPREFVEAHGLSFEAPNAPVYREWVSRRARLARRYFQAGRVYIARVRNWRCRLAGFAYLARFEWILERIERDGYSLQPDYPARKTLRAGIWLIWRTLTALFTPSWRDVNLDWLAVQTAQSEVQEW